MHCRLGILIRYNVRSGVMNTVAKMFFPDILGMRRVCRDKKASVY